MKYFDASVLLIVTALGMWHLSRDHRKKEQMTRPSELVMMLMSLSDAALADRLRRIAEDVRWAPKAERRAYLIEAARRLQDGASRR